MKTSVVLLLALLTPALSHGGDKIFSAAIFSPAAVPYLPPPATTMEVPGWLIDANRIAAEIVVKFLGGFIADKSGIEHPNPDERPIDYFVKRIGDSNFQFLLQGVGNLKYLGGPYYYNELQGGVGVEYDFITPDDSETSTLLAVRVSPLYGEIALIRTGSGARPAPDLPHGVFLGSSFGIEASRRLGRLEPGVRAYARLEGQADGNHHWGASFYSAAYCRIRLSDFEPGRMPHQQNGSTMQGFYLTPVIAFYDRGGAKEDLYSWKDRHDTSARRNVGDIRRVWEALLRVELSY